MKKVLYIHQYFKTPNEPGGTRSYWLARELMQNGYEVTMLTTGHSHTEKVKTSIVEGIKVVSFSVAYNQSMGIKDRLKSFTSFMYHCSRYALKNSNSYDFIFATSTPLTVGIPALLAKWFKNKSYIFEVRDLWPEVPIQMGAFKNPLIIKTMRWLEKTIYKNAAHVIALSPGMQDGVLKYIPKDKTSMIPNMSKKDEFWPREKNLALMKEIGLREDCLKIIHFGSLGVANGIDTVINSAYLLKNEKIQFLLLGAGSTEKNIRSKIKELDMHNVLFCERTPMKMTSEIVNICDVSLVSFKDLPILFTNSPNKLFDSLSAGKPIIVNSAGWTKDLVENNRCGIYCDPKDPKNLADKLVALSQNKALLQEMGENSRRLSEEVYDKSILVKQFVNVVNETFKKD